MKVSGHRAHLEYISKVLGVRTLLTGPTDPSSPYPLLRVVFEKSDLKGQEELLRKIIAAWELEPDQCELLQLETLNEKSLSAALSKGGDGQAYVLVFAEAPTEPPSPRAIFASTLARLAQETPLKKRLWENIQQARRTLQEERV